MRGLRRKVIDDEVKIVDYHLRDRDDQSLDEGGLAIWTKVIRCIRSLSRCARRRAGTGLARISHQWFYSQC